MCMSMYLCKSTFTTFLTSTQGCQRASDPQELELQVTVSYLTRMLGTEPGSSGSRVRVLTEPFFSSP